MPVPGTVPHVAACHGGHKSEIIAVAREAGQSLSFRLPIMPDSTMLWCDARAKRMVGLARATKTSRHAAAHSSQAANPHAVSAVAAPAEYDCWPHQSPPPDSVADQWQSNSGREPRAIQRRRRVPHALGAGQLDTALGFGGQT